MAKKSLVTYIEKELKRGFSKEEIHKELRMAGHDLQEIEDVFSHVGKKKKMRSFNYITLGAIVIFVVIALIISMVPLEESEPKTGQKATKADQQLFDDAITKNNLSVCNKITATALKENCISLLATNEKESTEEEKADQQLFDSAIVNDDVALCDGIKDEAMKQNCKGLLTPVAVQKTEQETNDQSLFDEAIVHNDIAVCDRITNSALKENCKSLLS